MLHPARSVCVELAPCQIVRRAQVTVDVDGSRPEASRVISLKAFVRALLELMQDKFLKEPVEIYLE